VESRSAQSAVRHDEAFRKEYRHRCHAKPRGVAKVAAARKLAVRLYWMLRTQTPYPQIVHNEDSPSHPVVGAS
jgi:transposase